VFSTTIGTMLLKFGIIYCLLIYSGDDTAQVLELH